MPNRNYCLLLAALTLLTFFSAVDAGAAKSATKPNIVFIIADDLGWAELGCYGQTKIKTPRVDSLARDGMKFTQAYAGNAVCAPSRCVLMTGKHPGHATVRNNRRMKPEGQFPLPAAEATIASLFAREGYRSGAFGKWGLGNTESTGNPLNKGFHRFFGYNCQSHAHSFYPATLWSDNELFPLKNDPPISGHGKLPADLDANDPASYSIFKGQDYAPERINGQALEFIRDNQDGPFFLYYPTIIPHLALHVPDKDLEQYHVKGWQETPFTARERRSYTPHHTPRAGYAAFITKMDTYVGRVLDLLDELKLTENTIVVFTSDNGATYLPEVDFEFFASVGPLRGLKGSLYEGGIRVPLIVRWPGKIPAGTETDVLTGLEDWLPTLLELTGVETKSPAGIDGVSLAPVLLRTAKKGSGGRDFLYREFPAYGGQQSVWLDGGKWKAIKQNLITRGKRRGRSVAGGSDAAPGKLELYNLQNDIGESKDVADAHPEIAARAEALMKREHVPTADFPFAALDGPAK
ncbi:MAG: arylsulfatase [Verrucomicrobiia bacterium]|jgi:arylsulfatase A-like enzyme